jgi:hypothetical protein
VNHADRLPFELNDSELRSFLAGFTHIPISRMRGLVWTATYFLMSDRQSHWRNGVNKHPILGHRKSGWQSAILLRNWSA